MIAGFPPLGTPSAPPSRADGTPEGLAPVLQDSTNVGLEGSLRSSQARRLRTDAITRTVRTDGRLKAPGCSQRAVRV
jgi:hypothetical protein